MRAIEGLLVDLDGTVYEGNSLIPGSAEAVQRLRERGTPFLFTTNTSRKSRRDVAASLSEMGLRVGVDEIFTAPVAAAGWLAARGIHRVQLLLPESTHADFEGFEITATAPAAVLVGDMGREFTFELLNRAFRNLRAGAQLVAIHKNRFWLPLEGATLDAGPFVAALEYATGLEAMLVGKPAPAFFETAAALLGMRPTVLAVIGDDIESDVKGGRAAGLTTFQVRTGKYDAALVEQTGPAGIPDETVATFADVVALLD
jgi:HAD superfamily hydrolase (TIGR01458 family)